MRQQPARAFLVSNPLAAPSPAELAGVERALQLACSRSDASGTPIRLLATGYLPAQQRWLGLLLADDPEAVSRVAAVAQLVTSRVVEV